jgi:hypothetical protein
LTALIEIGENGSKKRPVADQVGFIGFYGFSRAVSRNCHALFGRPAEDGVIRAHRSPSAERSRFSEQLRRSAGSLPVGTHASIKSLYVVKTPCNASQSDPNRLGAPPRFDACPPHPSGLLETIAALAASVAAALCFARYRGAPLALLR